ncbi:hypothetical protein [Xanthomonas theicola]|uniref:Uncharacterized protein n=1 Tax=Xanthomonas theicola TaxID=56464 RepID=A0A2S6ZCS0_9XANT|nr:hypothetical protein [Xanthomonas theicola]PPT88454.1 hypothetical protein XthCFBP4691_14335 [Xanthomonas theicola]QNH23600.1 hypothetical protein G4Q83_00815 [Xanthomonas theicola]
MNGAGYDHQQPWRQVMRIHAVQFQPGLSVAEFIERDGAEVERYRALSRWRWPKVVAARSVRAAVVRASAAPGRTATRAEPAAARPA